jgi:hypothetical protein
VFGAGFVLKLCLPIGAAGRWAENNKQKQLEKPLIRPPMPQDKGKGILAYGPG